MKQLKIEDIKPGSVDGVQVYLPNEADVHKEIYYTWAASPLTAATKKCEIAGGFLHTWHYYPKFDQIETHVDSEMFFFVSGTALMLFVDVKDGKPQMNTAVIKRIKPGTQIIIAPGKGHFVPVAEGSDPIVAIVVSPKMDAPRMPLPEAVSGI